MANLSITAADVSTDSGNAKIVTWGEAVTAGELVHATGANLPYSKSDAAALNDSTLRPYTGIALTTGAEGQQGLVAPANAVAELGDVLTRGDVYVASATAGKICSPSDLTASVDEIQTVSLSGGTGGTFTLTFDGETTAAIAYDAAAADVKSALEALANIDEVTVGGGPMNTAGVTVEFTGTEVRRQDVALMTIDDALVTGSPTSSIVETTAGVAGDFLTIVGYATSNTEMKLVLLPTAAQK